MKKFVNSESGFTLIELFVLFPLSIVLAAEIGMVLKYYYLQSTYSSILLAFLIYVGLAAALLYLIIWISHYIPRKYKIINIFLMLIFWISIFISLAILPLYFLKDFQFIIIINSVLGFMILVWLYFIYFSSFMYKKEKKSKKK